MRHVVTGGLCVLDRTMRCATMAELIEMLFGGVDSGWHKEPCIRWGPQIPQG